jgi:hypothetical protein
MTWFIAKGSLVADGEGADGVWLHPVGAGWHTVLPVVQGGTKTR